MRISIPEIPVWIWIGVALSNLVTAVVVYWLYRLISTLRLKKSFKDRSRSVVKGLVTEQMAPLLGEFPGDPSDARFLGSPIDYIVFDGLSDGDVDEIVFVEVKTHRGVNLTSSERAVRDAVKEKRVRWVQYSPDL